MISLLDWVAALNEGEQGEPICSLHFCYSSLFFPTERLTPFGCVICSSTTPCLGSKRKPLRPEISQSARSAAEHAFSRLSECLIGIPLILRGASRERGACQRSNGAQGPTDVGIELGNEILFSINYSQKGRETRIKKNRAHRRLPMRTLIHPRADIHS